MKKIININLSGRVIPIEDSAYEKLKGYVESLRRFFAHEESREEIINDIESRIAELMNDKIRMGATVITDADVDSIIASMGTLEDFEAVENDSISGSAAVNSGAQQESYTQAKRQRTRLYRDTGDKFIGGVCAGIANYLNVDPAIVRILFAIITFGGFGIGVLAYILLWIVLPPKDLEGYSGKRLFRNPDDKVIGGVAGGLAAYFNKSSNTIRLIFAAPLILNILFGILSWPFFDEGSLFPNLVFGSLSGTFILAYIVLWIVLPEANSPYQKMEMRGEKVDLNTIRQNVVESAGNVKDRMKGWGNEVKDTAQNLGSKAKEFANTRGRAFAAEAGDAARRTGRGIGHIIGVLFKVFFLFIAGSIAFALFVALIGILAGGVGVWPFKNFLLDGFWQNTYAWGTLILFLGVPLIAFIIWLLRRLMRVKSHNNYLGWTFGGLWALGWVSLTLFIASMVRDVRASNYRRPADEVAVSNPANGKMIVRVTEREIQYTGAMPWVDFDGEGFDITEDTLRLSNIRIAEIDLSPDSNYHVFVKKYSKGRTVADAEARAQKMGFYYSYTDSFLNLGSHLTIDKYSKFRGQEVLITIQVPAGKKIYFDETIKRLHSFVKFRFDDDHNNRRVDIDDDYEFGYRTNTEYTMGADGTLRDDKGETAAPVNNDYRYQQDIDSIRLEQEIERKRKELEDLEKRKKNTAPQVRVIKDERMESRSVQISGPNAGILPMEWF
jgi:phage shock protein PspC (stress-responsive transcriptional regulator)